MDHEMLGLMFRGIERLIIVTAAFAAIWQGFRLFSTVVSDKGSFEGYMGEWKVKLQRVAPGVFFACFGAIILSFSVSAPFSYKAGEPTTQGPGTLGNWQKDVQYISNYPGTNDKTKAQKLIVDLTTVTGFLSMPDLLGKMSTDDKMKVGDAIVRLNNHRMSLIDGAFGSGWRDKYHKYVAKFKTPEKAKSSLSDEEYKVFSAIFSSLSFKLTD